MLGWDLLRGLCALSVALYHLLYWQELASLHTLGSYGVYLFFILSGASLAYTYAGKMRSPGQVANFLLTRWMRLAPLYIVLCLVFVAFLSLRNGALVDQLALRFSLNFSFAFGFYDPVVWALLIGGWSLGIEFIYYLVFPLLLAVAPRVVWSVLLALALAVLQWCWVYRTAGSDAGYAASAVAYHQAPAFAAYFFGGCLIGYWRRMRELKIAQQSGVLAWLLMACLLLWLNPARAGDELTGIRGALLFCACFAVVFTSGQVAVGSGLAPLARWLGDITYGCYLLHPMFFFGFVWFVWPHLGMMDITQAPLAVRLAMVAAVLILSCTTAAASERWLEAPLRRWGKRLMRPAAVPRELAYKDDAKISS